MADLLEYERADQEEHKNGAEEDQNMGEGPIELIELIEGDQDNMFGNQENSGGIGQNGEEDKDHDVPGEVGQKGGEEEEQQDGEHSNQEKDLQEQPLLKQQLQDEEPQENDPQDQEPQEREPHDQEPQEQEPQDQEPEDQTLQEQEQEQAAEEDQEGGGNQGQEEQEREERKSDTQENENQELELSGQVGQNEAEIEKYLNSHEPEDGTEDEQQEAAEQDEDFSQDDSRNNNTYECEQQQDAKEGPEEEPEEQDFSGSDDTQVHRGNFSSTGSGNASRGKTDVFSRLSSCMTGIHKYGGRRAVSNVHSARLSNNSIYGGGAVRDRGWLRIAEDSPGFQGDPHSSSEIGSSGKGTGIMQSSASRFCLRDAKGRFHSKRDIEASAERTPYLPPSTFAESGGSNRAISWGKTDRFVDQTPDGRFVSKRDAADRAARRQSSDIETYSSFKASSEKRRFSSSFGGSVARFVPRTSSGHYLIQKKANDKENINPKGSEFTPPYSSFSKSSIKSTRSSHFGSTTCRFSAPTEKKNGGMVTPGPGAFELTPVGAKGFFGATESPHATISLLA